MKVAVVYMHALGLGGYPRDVRWLTGALDDMGINVTLFCGRGNVTDGLRSSVKIESLQNIRKADADLFHMFGVMIPAHVYCLADILMRGKCVVISPLGQLMPLFLRRRRLKKEVYLQVIKPLLSRSNGYHVFSRIEAASVERFLSSNIRTFQAPLGVFPPPRGVFRKQGKSETGLRLLFLGRNDVHQKGIDYLLEGFAKAISDGMSGQLTIAGQPWGDSHRFITSFIDQRGMRERMRVVGPVDEEAKWALLAGADYLVFLSRWDGPPRPVREAISIGTPVIVSPETNKGDLVEKYGAGMQVSLNPGKVARALVRVSQESGLRAQHSDGALVLGERLQWNRVATDYIHGYRRVLATWK
ncbi:MAG: glycosyltransferase [Chloroflexi bacterium]|nr:glycosyltransferase [Chloroflexota bacterium]